MEAREIDVEFDGCIDFLMAQRFLHSAKNGGHNRISKLEVEYGHGFRKYPNGDRSCIELAQIVTAPVDFRAREGIRKKVTDGT